MRTIFPNTTDLEEIALRYVEAVQDYTIVQSRLGMRALSTAGPHGEHFDEDEENPSFVFDRFSNDLLLKHLIRCGVSCHLFSEEAQGWQVLGDRPEYFVICDPFCNSWLTTRGFHESAVAICIADADGGLVVCALADLQARYIFFATPKGAYVWRMDDNGHWKRSPIHVSDTRHLSEAFVVVSLLKKKRRRHNAFAAGVCTELIREAKYFHTIDGAIMLGRLAAGAIDCYLDPFLGQPVYEIPCCEIIVKAGGIVTDTLGRPFTLSETIAALSKSKENRFRLVASCTQELHEQLLLMLSNHPNAISAM
jgi:fructose-1,6-bisphosphatase/inositol monophosphatase family enzyme